MLPTGNPVPACRKGKNLRFEDHHDDVFILFLGPATSFFLIHRIPISALSALFNTTQTIIE